MKPVRLSLIRILFIIVLLATLGAATTSAQAPDPPVQLSYQGLVKVGGVPFNGVGSFTFAIVNAPTGDGVTLWSTGPETLTVSNGLFNFLLGSTTPLPSSVFANDPIYLRVWFNGTALEPNQRIVSAAYALRAEDAAKLGGSPASDYLKTTSALDASNLASGTVPLARLPGIPWAQLTGVPASLADGDDDTTYSAGANLTLSGTTFSLASPLSTDVNMGGKKVTSLGDPTANGDATNKLYVDAADAALQSAVAALDASKVNLSGDTMTGMLTVAAPIVAGDYVKIGASGAACDSGKTGSVRWNSTTSSLELCDGIGWQPLQVAQKPIVMYNAGAMSGSAIGGRAGADAKCAAAAGKPAGYSRFRGFLSVNAGDEIRDMPVKYGVPTVVPVISTIDKMVTNNWYDILDSSINLPLAATGVLPGSSFWWSGSIPDGSVVSSSTCGEWIGGGSGRTGNGNVSDPSWLSSTDGACTTPAYLVCIAY